MFRYLNHVYSKYNKLLNGVAAEEALQFTIEDHVLDEYVQLLGEFEVKEF